VIQDRLLLRASTLSGTSISADQLISRLREISSNRARVRYLLLVRRQQSVAANEATINTLTDLLRDRSTLRLGSDARDEIGRLIEELTRFEVHPVPVG
jgi:hypothetical protein